MKNPTLSNTLAQFSLFIVLIMAFSFVPRIADARPFPDEKNCDFSAFNERFIFIPMKLSDFKPGDAITLGFQHQPSRQGKYGLVCGTAGGAYFTFSIEHAPMGWRVRYSTQCADKIGTSISLNPTESMVTLLAYYLLNREVHASAQSCAGSATPQHANASTNFSMPRFLDFLKCYKAYYDKCKADPTKAKEAEYLKKYLDTMLKTKIGTMEDALANQDLLRIHVPLPRVTPAEVTAQAATLKGIQSGLATTSEITIP